ncbi:DUF2637 domain-containing protein [Kitasatospora sp. NPDC002227]|uniref:DUF2637 domain-containing protein n=1 Tax=Kitasatospora sp. NPDC002227 TaxID=3154773 RepID=UPI003324EB49
MTRPTLNWGHKLLAAVVVVFCGAVAGIGFVGSYTAVRALAERHGFGDFSAVFPVGVDAGIVGLYALDLLMTWLRMPYPLLRQTAWFLTGATIAFNSASAWPNPLGVGMHGVIPVLFIIVVEAARYGTGRWANLTAGAKTMEGLGITRWFLAPISTALLWRRKHLWGIHSADEAILLEQQRRIYRARLRFRYGRGWRRAAHQDALLPLEMAKYGVPFAETAAEGLAAAGITTGPLTKPSNSPAGNTLPSGERPMLEKVPAPADRTGRPEHGRQAQFEPAGEDPAIDSATAQLEPAAAPHAQVPERSAEIEPETAPVPVAPQQLVLDTADPAQQPVVAVEVEAEVEAEMLMPALPEGEDLISADQPEPAVDQESQNKEDLYYTYWCEYVREHGDYPTKKQFVDYIFKKHRVAGQGGNQPVSPRSLDRYWPNMQSRYKKEFETPQHSDPLTGQLAGV